MSSRFVSVSTRIQTQVGSVLNVSTVPLPHFSIPGVYVSPQQQQQQQQQHQQLQSNQQYTFKAQQPQPTQQQTRTVHPSDQTNQNEHTQVNNLNNNNHNKNNNDNNQMVQVQPQQQEEQKNVFGTVFKSFLPKYISTPATILPLRTLQTALYMAMTLLHRHDQFQKSVNLPSLLTQSFDNNLQLLTALGSIASKHNIVRYCQWYRSEEWVAKTTMVFLQRFLFLAIATGGVDNDNLFIAQTTARRSGLAVKLIHSTTQPDLKTTAAVQQHIYECQFQDEIDAKKDIERKKDEMKKKGEDEKKKENEKDEEEIIVPEKDKKGDNNINNNSSNDASKSEVKPTPSFWERFTSTVTSVFDSSDGESDESEAKADQTSPSQTLIAAEDEHVNGKAPLNFSLPLPYNLFYDPTTYSFIISIGGFENVDDILSYLISWPRQYGNDGYLHSGLFLIARKMLPMILNQLSYSWVELLHAGGKLDTSFYGELKDKGKDSNLDFEDLIQLSSTLPITTLSNQFPNVVFTGMNIGGGVASILTLLLRDYRVGRHYRWHRDVYDKDYKNTTINTLTSTHFDLLEILNPDAIIFSPPAVFSPSLHFKSRKFTISVINNDDIVPHLSEYSMNTFLAELFYETLTRDNKTPNLLTNPYDDHTPLYVRQGLHWKDKGEDSDDNEEDKNDAAADEATTTQPQQPTITYDHITPENTTYTQFNHESTPVEKKVDKKPDTFLGSALWAGVRVQQTFGKITNALTSSPGSFLDDFVEDQLIKSAKSIANEALGGATEAVYEDTTERYRYLADHNDRQCESTRIIEYEVDQDNIVKQTTATLIPIDQALQPGTVISRNNGELIQLKNQDNHPKIIVDPNTHTFASSEVNTSLSTSDVVQSINQFIVHHHDSFEKTLPDAVFSPLHALIKVQSFSKQVHKYIQPAGHNPLQSEAVVVPLLTEAPEQQTSHHLDSFLPRPIEHSVLTTSLEPYTTRVNSNPSHSINRTDVVYQDKEYGVGVKKLDDKNSVMATLWVPGNPIFLKKLPTAIYATLHSPIVITTEDKTILTTRASQVLKKNQNAEVLTTTAPSTIIQQKEHTTFPVWQISQKTWLWQGDNNHINVHIIPQSHMNALSQPLQLPLTLSTSLKTIKTNPLLSVENGFTLPTSNEITTTTIIQPTLTQSLMFASDTPAFPTYINPLEPVVLSRTAQLSTQARQQAQLTPEQEQIEDMMSLHRSKDTFQASNALMISVIDTLTDTIVSQKKLLLGINLLTNSDFKHQFSTIRNSLEVPTTVMSVHREPYEFSSVHLSEQMTCDHFAMSYVEAFDTALGTASITTMNRDLIKMRLKMKRHEKELRMEQITGKKADDGNSFIVDKVHNYFNKVHSISPQDIILKKDVSDYFLTSSGLVPPLPDEILSLYTGNDVSPSTPNTPTINNNNTQSFSILSTPTHSTSSLSTNFTQSSAVSRFLKRDSPAK